MQSRRSRMRNNARLYCGLRSQRPPMMLEIRFNRSMAFLDGRRSQTFPPSAAAVLRAETTRRKPSWISAYNPRPGGSLPRQCVRRTGTHDPSAPVPVAMTVAAIESPSYNTPRSATAAPLADVSSIVRNHGGRLGPRRWRPTADAAIDPTCPGAHELPDRARACLLDARNPSRQSASPLPPARIDETSGSASLRVLSTVLEPFRCPV